MVWPQNEQKTHLSGILNFMTLLWYNGKSSGTYFLKNCALIHFQLKGLCWKYLYTQNPKLKLQSLYEKNFQRALLTHRNSCHLQGLHVPSGPRRCAALAGLTCPPSPFHSVFISNLRNTTFPGERGNVLPYGYKRASRRDNSWWSYPTDPPLPWHLLGLFSHNCVLYLAIVIRKINLAYVDQMYLLRNLLNLLH